MIECDAHRRGLDLGDELVYFAGRLLTSVNQYKNVLGIYPRGWRVPLVYRRGAERREVLVRLMGVQRQELIERNPGRGPRRTRCQARPQAACPTSRPPSSSRPSPASPITTSTRSSATALMTALKAQGDFSTVQGTWAIKATGGFVKGKRATSRVVIKDKGARDGKNELIESEFDGIEFNLEPLANDQTTLEFKYPTGSGGFLIAMYQYRQLLAFGEKGFIGQFSHGGVEPFYLLPGEKERPDYAKLRVDCEVLRTEHAGYPAKWYFALKDDPARKIAKGQLVGFEVTVDREDDPCEVYLSDYQKTDGRMLPQRIDVVFGDKPFATMSAITYTLSGAK